MSRAISIILAAASVLATGAAAQAAPDGDDPGTGALLAKMNGTLVAMPMVSMDVRLSVSGPMVRSHVQQAFSNPTDETLEAVYVFPLPEGAAVDDLTLEVGGRSFVGEIQEKGEARGTYERAKAEGKGAGLVEQHRPNIFRTSVANIPPHASVSVHLGLVDEAEWDSGTFSTVFPMTITERYSPSGTQAAFSGPGPEALSVTVAAHIDAGVPLAEIACPSHAIRTITGRDGVSVKVGDGPVAADRDFVLRWRPSVLTAPIAGGLVEERGDGRYGLAMLVPPEIDRPNAMALPTQTVFVVDVSGSMRGPSLDQAKAALTVALDRLRPGDTFTLIKFDSANEAYSESFLHADGAAVEDAKRWVEGLAAGSGTEILPALIRALELSERGDARSARRVVLITDGAVENEEQVLAAVSGALGGTRLHIVGIGLAPNRWLMKELARVGRGAYVSIGTIEEVKARTTELLLRTERSVITDVALEWEGAAPLDAGPDPVPDLYAGRPLVVTARFDPSKPLPKLRVWGRAAGGPVTIDVDFRAAREDSGIATRWARARIGTLENARIHGADPIVIRADVIDLAKRFRLVTPYTSFVVVADDVHADDAGDEDGGLPQGGTDEPLLLAIGAALSALGATILWAATRAKARAA